MIWPFSKKRSVTGNPELDAVFEKIASFIENEQQQNNLYPDALKQRVVAGADVDEIPAAFGEFGLALTNPVPVNGPVGEVVYLSALRHLGKTKILFHRIGSLNGIDIFEAVSVDGTGWTIFYSDMYHPRKSRRSPKGFSISSAPVASFRGTNFEVQDFPYGLSKAIAAYSEKTLGIAMSEPDIRQAEERIKFVRPKSHVAFVADLRKGNLQVAKRSVSYGNLSKVIIDSVLREVEEILPAYKQEIGRFLAQRGALNGNTLLMYEHASFKFAVTACITAAWCWSLFAVFEKKDGERLLHEVTGGFKAAISEPVRELFDEVFGLAFNSAILDLESGLTPAERIADALFATLQFNDNPKAVSLIENKAFLSKFSHPFHNRSTKLNSLKAQYVVTEP